MYNISQISRYLLALILLIFGTNKIVPFLDLPPYQVETSAGIFYAGIFASGYLWYLIAITETVVGVLLILNRWVPLALLVLFPHTLNIVLFHLFNDLPSITAGAVAFVLNIFLMLEHKEKYRPLLQPS